MAEKWCLNDIYPGYDSPQFLADFNDLKPLVEAMNAAASALQSFEDVARAIALLEEYSAKLDRISSYCNYTFAANTADEDSAKYLYQLEALNAETSRAQVRLAKFLATVADIPSQAAAHGLGHYSYWLGFIAEDFSHMLSEDEETIISQMATTGSSAWEMMHEKLVSNLTCEYQGRSITINECRNLAYDPSQAVRKAAYEAELAAYKKIEEPSAAAINGIKGEVNLLARLRKFDSPLAQTLFNSAMSSKTLAAMFQAIDANIHYLRSYLQAKAKYLGHQGGLPFYDLFAPVGKTAEKPFSYTDAKKFVEDNFAKFSPGMADVARLAFDNNWVDVEPREGKVSGAFCGDTYAIKQFRILLNFGGSLGDVITLAHELGHGYHSMQVMEEGILNTRYPMPLAETASTFCEAIVTNAALETLPQAEKLQLLENSLQDATQVIVDIYSRFLFEKGVFEARQSHPLSVTELNELMLTAQQKAYGNGLAPDAMHQSMWVIKPHYYSTASYYNFPYAFGHLLANGLYKIYETNSATFGAKYDAFLRASGKMSIADSCKMLDINVESVDFWNDAMDVIKDRIAEFERCVS